MTDYAKIVPIPAPGDMNTGLHPPTSAQMVQLFGIPGNSDPDCGEVTHPKLKRRIITKYVGPFPVTGFDVVVEALHKAFLILRDEQGNEELFEALRTAGMLCVRKKRSGNGWSNHSWGTSIDLFCGEGVVDQGKPFTQAGLLAFYPILHSLGFYWGAGYSGTSVDSMHFDYSWEYLQNIDY